MTQSVMSRVCIAAELAVEIALNTDRPDALTVVTTTLDEVGPQYLPLVALHWAEMYWRALDPPDCDAVVRFSGFVDEGFTPVSREGFPALTWCMEFCVAVYNGDKHAVLDQWEAADTRPAFMAEALACLMDVTVQACAAARKS